MYLFLFLRHLSFELLFHSILIFLNFQFHCSFLVIVLFKGLYVDQINPQVKESFQNLQSAIKRNKKS